MHEIVTVCFYPFFLSFSYNRYQTVYPTFSKIFCKIVQIFKISDRSPFSPEVRSIAERYHRKLAAKLSVFFVTAHFRIVWSTFREKAKWKTSRYQWQRQINLIVTGENAYYNCALLEVYGVFREKAKLCVFLQICKLLQSTFLPKTQSKALHFRWQLGIGENLKT